MEVLVLIISVCATFLCLIGLVINQYLLKRNTKVHDFKVYLIDLASETWKRDYYNSKIYDYEEEFRPILDKYSYDKMLYSTKPLNLESWFTEKEIEKLKNGKTE